jgi:hypothetical protein
MCPGATCSGAHAAQAKHWPNCNLALFDECFRLSKIRPVILHDGAEDPMIRTFISAFASV